MGFQAVGIWKYATAEAAQVDIVEHNIRWDVPKFSGLRVPRDQHHTWITFEK